MKATTELIEKKPEFEPFRLVIDVESEDEACALWHRLQLASEVVREASVGASKETGVRLAECFTCFAAWAVLDNRLLPLGIRTNP